MNVKRTLSILAVFIAILITVCIATVTAFISAWFADYVYNNSHAIPNPVERGDDLGAGLVAVFWATIGFIGAIPLVVPFTRYIHRKLDKVITGEK